MTARGKSLLLLAFVWALVGVGLLLDKSQHIPATWHDQAPLWVRVAWWWVPAALAVGLHRSRRHDWVALAALSVGPIVRGLSYLTSWFLWLRGSGGYAFGWYSAAFYLAMIGWVLVTASLQERGERPHHDGGDES